MPAGWRSRSCGRGRRRSGGKSSPPWRRRAADGYALRFPGEARWLATLAEFIRFERACCPFLRFELHAEQQDGPLWLRLRGPVGVKEFLAALLPPPAATPLR